MLKRSFCLVMILILMLSVMVVHAEQADREPATSRYSYVDSVYASLSISGTTATCAGKGRGMYTDTATRIYVTLRRRVEGSYSWSTVKIWTATANGIGTALVSETWPVTAGYSYQIHVRCLITDSSGNALESVNQYSAIWTI